MRKKLESESSRAERIGRGGYDIDTRARNTGRTRVLARAIRAVGYTGELLEARRLLSGAYVLPSDPLTATAIDATQATRLKSGLTGLVSWIDAAAETGVFAEDLQFLRSTGNEVAIESLDFWSQPAAKVQSTLASAVDNYFNTVDPSTPTTGELVTHLLAQPGITAARAGLDSLGQELRIDLTLTTQTTVLTSFLPEVGDEVLVSFVNNVAGNVVATVALGLTFGIDLNPQLGDDEAFFTRDLALDASLDATVTNVNAPVTVGFLDATTSNASIDVDLDARLNATNVDADANSRVTLAELNGYDIVSTAEVTTLADTIAATIPVAATIGSYTATGSPSVTVSGGNTGTGPVSTNNAAFNELKQFGNVDAANVLNGFQALRDLFGELSTSDTLGMAAPFAGGFTLGTAADLGTAVDSKLVSLLDDAAGAPAFASAQTLATLLQSVTTVNPAVGYDAATNRLTYTIDIPRHTFGAFTAPFELNFAAGVLRDLASDSLVTVSPRTDVSFNLQIDLSNGVSYENIVDRMLLRNALVETRVATTGSALSGLATYGFTRLNFSGASIANPADYTLSFAPLAGALEAEDAWSLDNLFDAVAESTLGETITEAGVPTLSMPSLSVVDNVFNAGSAVLTATADNLVESTGNAISAGSAALQALAGTTIDTVKDGLVRGMSAATTILESPVDFATNLGVATYRGFAQFGSNLASAILAPALDVAAEAAEAATGSALAIQDVAGVVTEALIDAGAAVAGDVVTVGVNATTGAIEVGLAVGSEVVGATTDMVVDLAQYAADAGGSVAGLSGVDTFDIAGDPLSMNVGAVYNIDLAIDPTTGAPTVDDSSYFEIEYYTDTQNLDGDGSADGFGVTLSNGRITAAQSTTAPASTAPNTKRSSLPARPAGYTEADVGTTTPTTSGTGKIKINFNVANGATGAGLPNLTIDVGNVGVPFGNTTIPSVPNFASLISGLNLTNNVSGLAGGLESLFDGFQTGLIDQVLSLPFPLIGDKLQELVDVFADLKAKVVDPIKNAVSYTASNIEVVLEGVLGPGTVTLVITGSGGGTEVRYDVTIADTINVVALDESTNLGIPALNADLSADFNVDISYSIPLSFGINLAKGVFLVTSAPAELTMTVSSELVGSLSGKMGFLSVDATTTGAEAALQFAVDIKDPNNNDGRIYQDELLDLLNGDIGGGNLSNLISATVDDTLPSGIGIDLTISAKPLDFLPAIAVDLSIDWPFTGTDNRGLRPTVKFEDARIMVGGFIARTFGPLLETLDGILEPVYPVLDILDTQVQILEDMGFGEVTILDLAKTFASNFDVGFIDAALQVIDFINFIESLSFGDEITVHLSDLDFNRSNVDLFSKLPDDFDAGDLADIADSINAGALDDFLVEAGTSFSGYVDSSVGPQSGALTFPILENPLSAFELLLGLRDDVALVAYDLPLLNVKAGVNTTIRPFPIFPIFKIDVAGTLEVGANLKIGLDTKGAVDFLASGDPLDLFNGFYLSDRENADGTGEDVPEFYVEGGLKLYAGLGIPVLAEAKVGGGIEMGVGADFNDKDNDGKIRAGEIECLDELFAFNGYGRIQFEAIYKLLGVGDEYPLGSIELFEFNTPPGDCPDPLPPFANLGTILNVGGVNTLFLHTGPRAVLRDVKPGEVNESFVVTREGAQIVVQAFGHEERFAAGGVQKIEADGGSGKDTITIESNLISVPVVLFGGDGRDHLSLVGTPAPATLEGGNGDDYLAGGNSSTSMLGGAGNDTLKGSGSNDTLRGDAGNDRIVGFAGNDCLFGGDGLDTLLGGDGNDTLQGQNQADLLNGELGNDSLDGGNDADQLIGGPESAGTSLELDYDTLRGQAGNDTLIGGYGIDSMFGSTGSDSLNGGAGNDVMNGDDNDDTLQGGIDNDTITDTLGANFIDAGDGQDTVTAGALNDSIFGGAGIDCISAGDGADSIYADVGNDLVDAGAGNDTVDAGDGNDAVTLGTGDDVAYGGIGNDTVLGDAGNDTIEGNAGLDSLFGGIDNDSLVGRDGQDSLYGEDGNDTMLGGGANDVIVGAIGADSALGGPGKDTIEGNDGNDTLDGGNDDDTIYADNGADLVRGGKGNDILWGGFGNDTVRGQEGLDLVTGFDDDDSLSGDADDDIVYAGRGFDAASGGAGNDRIFGERGFDSIYAGAGDDYAEGGDGDDLLRGGNDNDTLLGEAGGDNIAGGTGDDLVNAGDGGAHTLAGDDGDDTIYGGDDAGRIEGDSITGGAGDDLIEGLGGGDTIDAGAGDDTVYAGDQADSVLGNDGNDILNGEDGNDTVRGDAGHDRIDGGRGYDSLDGGAGDDYLSAFTGQFETQSGGDGDDLIYGSPDGNDSMNGGNGDDRLLGLAGNDTINGDAGNDTLEGAEGTDSLFGQAGRDVLIGGIDGDILFGHNNGGAGDDNLPDTLFGDNGDDNTALVGAGRDQLNGNGGNDFLFGEGGLDSLASTAGDRIDYGNGSTVAEAYTVPAAAPAPAASTLTPPNRVTLDLNNGVTPYARWGGLSGVDAGTGVSPFDGFEHSIVEYDGDLIAAWSAPHNGNYEIYVAKYNRLLDLWQEFYAGTASGFGVSNTATMSAQPSLAVFNDNRGSATLLLAWTETDIDGNRNLQVSRYYSGAFETVDAANLPGQDGHSFAPQLVPTTDGFRVLYLNDSGPLQALYSARYQNDAVLVGAGDWLTGGNNLNLEPLAAIYSFDVASSTFYDGLVYSSGIEPVRRVKFHLALDAGFSAGTQVYSTPALTDDASAPTIVSFPEANQEHVSFYFAWQSQTDRSSQVEAMHFETFFPGLPTFVESKPKYFGESVRSSATSISDTTEYATRPELSADAGTAHLYWQHDGTLDGDADAALFQMHSNANNNFVEMLPSNALGDGIVETSGAFRSLTSSADGDRVVAWGQPAPGTAGQLRLVRETGSGYLTASPDAGVAASIQNVLSGALTTGTVVLVDGGTYDGFTVPNNGGVTIRPRDADDVVVINGNITVNSAGVTIEGLTINGGVIVNANSDSLTLRRNTISPTSTGTDAIDIAGAVVGLVIVDNVISSTGAKGIDINAASFGEIARNRIVAGTRGIDLQAAFTGDIERNDIVGTTFGVRWNASTRLFDNDIHNSGTGVQVLVGDGNVGLGALGPNRRNRIWGNTTGVSISGATTVVQRQEIYDNTTGVSGSSGFLGTAQPGGANFIRDNATGVSMNNATVRFNAIYENNVGVFSGANLSVLNNILVDNAQNDVRVNGAVSGVNVQGNTIVSSASTGSINATAATGLTVRNNVIRNDAAAVFGLGASLGTVIVSNYNTLHTEGPNIAVVGATNHATLDAWRAATGEDLQSAGVTANDRTWSRPRFVHGGTDIYLLAPLAAGVRSSGVALRNADPSLNAGTPFNQGAYGLTAFDTAAVAPQIVLDSPLDATNLSAGTTVTLNWRSLGFSGGNVKIDLYQSTATGPLFVSTVVASTANDGNHSYTATSALTNAVFMVSRSGDAAVFDRSRDDVSGPVVAFTPLATNDSTPTLNGTINETTATVTVALLGVTYNATNNANGTWTLNGTLLPLLPDGTYDVVVTATDSGSNQTQRTYTAGLTIDATAPVVGFASLATADRQPALGGTVDDATATVVVRVNGVNYNAVNNGNGTWSVADNAIASLADGRYDVRVTATDAIGNVTIRNFPVALTIDGTAPTSTFAPVVTNDNTPDVNLLVNDATAVVTVTINGTAYEATRIAGTLWRVPGSSFAAPLPDGAYAVQVLAADPLGNASTITVPAGLTIDTLAPTVEIANVLTNDNTPPLTAFVGGATSVTISINGVDYAATQTTPGVWSIADNTVAALADGSYAVQVRATDAAGNVTTSVFADALIVDATRPTFTSAAFKFEWFHAIELTISEPLVGFTPSDGVIQNLTTGAIIPAASYTFTGGALKGTYRFTAPLADGNYRITFASTGFADAAGNAMASNYVFNFHALAGDGNRDKRVNFDDLLILAANYNQTGKSFSQGNFDLSPDGRVGFDDLLKLAANYNQSLPGSLGPDLLSAPPADDNGDGSDDDSRDDLGVLA